MVKKENKITGSVDSEKEFKGVTNICSSFEKFRVIISPNSNYKIKKDASIDFYKLNKLLEKIFERNDYERPDDKGTPDRT